MFTLTDQDLRTLRDHLGSAAVQTDPEAIRVASADSSARSRKAEQDGAPLARADVVLRPTSTEQVVAIVNWARQRGAPLVARGGGSGVVGSGLPTHGGAIVELVGLDAIGDVDRENRLVTVGAGVIGSDLEAVLAPYDLAVGHYPQSFSLASVGGWIAMRGSGTFSSLHGNIEDRIADLEVVLASGEIYRSRSLPRASEGPDLKSLFAGSEGTLGIITAATLKLVPKPQARRFDSARFERFTDALLAARRTLTAGVRPAVLRIYDPNEAQAKHARFAEGSGWLMVLLFDGHETLVDAQQQVTHEVISTCNGELLGPQPAVHWEQRRFDSSWFSDSVEATGGIAEAIEVTATWSQLPELYDSMFAAAASIMPEVMGHVSHVYEDGAALYLISRGSFATNAEATAAYEGLWKAVMDVCVRRGVRISHHHGIGTERLPWLSTDLGPVGSGLLEQITAAIDPHRIMNPGKLGGRSD